MARSVGFVAIVWVMIVISLAVSWMVASGIFSRRYDSSHAFLDGLDNKRQRAVIYLRNAIALPLYATYIHLVTAGVLALALRRATPRVFNSNLLIFDSVRLLNPVYLGACNLSCLVSILCAACATQAIVKYNKDAGGLIVIAALIPWFVVYAVCISANAILANGLRAGMAEVVVWAFLCSLVIVIAAMYIASRKGGGEAPAGRAGGGGQ